MKRRVGLGHNGDLCLPPQSIKENSHKAWINVQRNQLET